MQRIRFWTGVFLPIRVSRGHVRRRRAVREEALEPVLTSYSLKGAQIKRKVCSLMMAIPLTGAQDKRNRVGNSFFAVCCIAKRKAIEL